MNRDFEHWWNWYTKTYPNNIVPKEEAEKQYDEWYFCKCESCEYRKEHGQIPIRQSESCQLPKGRGDLNYIKSKV